jgi:hypothetical protein
MRWIIMSMAWFLGAALPMVPARAQTIAAAALPGGTTLPYYISAFPTAAVTAITIGVQGYNRDANRTFAATAAASPPGTVVVAPLFQVTARDAGRCHYPGTPPAAAGNALWTCGGWATGRPATNAGLTSFAAMDALLAQLHARYPGARRITLAGFSAGGQFVQHYIGFARPPAGVAMRYIVADPSAFVYFDSYRPYPPAPGTCPKVDDWRYGTADLPAYLGRGAAAARAVYAGADITYLEGGDDTGTSNAAAYRLLEKNCSAQAQGPFRLERGEAYARYDAAMLARGGHRLVIVPGCAHRVGCVFVHAHEIFE